MENGTDVRAAAHPSRSGPAMTGPFDGDVVVGVDGRPGGMDALALGERVARLAGGRLVVVASYPFAPLSSRALDGPTDASDARQVLDLACTALGKRDAELRTVPGSSHGRTLHEVAEEVDAGLIVVGSSHHGPAGRLVLGSVTAETLRRAPCAVAVAPRGWAAGARSLSRIGVALDGSARDAGAIEAARRLAGCLRPPAAVQTIHVVPPSGQGEAVSAQFQLEGDAADALAGHSRNLDLLILGSRGLGRMRSVVLGSVAARLVALARCPVLVLPTRTRDVVERTAEVAAAP
jgi:nucleotide-binding universal stress UspA family protein